MEILIKGSATLKVLRQPLKYEYCFVCKGVGKASYVGKFSDGYDVKVSKCLTCDGKGYREIQGV